MTEQAVSNSETISVLMVDDEQSMLTAVQRLLRSERFQLTVFDNANAALKGVEGVDFDVIISDMRMPEMDGAEFLTQMAEHLPNIPRILLTGYSDQESTVKAINDASIYRFVSKPWDNKELIALIEEAAKDKKSAQAKRDQAQSLAQENQTLQTQTEELTIKIERNESELEEAVAFVDLAKEQLQHSYETFIKAFSNIINQKIGEDAEMNRKIQEHINLICNLLKLDDDEKESIINAAQLHSLGKIFIPSGIIAKPFNSLTDKEKNKFYQHASLAEQALMPVTAMANTAKLLRHQNERFNGAGLPDKLTGAAIPLGSRILKMVIDYNQFMFGLFTGERQSAEESLCFIKDGIDSIYDPAVAQAYLSILNSKQADLIFENEQFVYCKQLVSGMVVARDVYNTNGMLLLSTNTRLDSELIKRLKNYEKSHKLELLVPVNNRKIVT